MRHRLFDTFLVFFPLITACIVALIVAQDDLTYTYWMIAITFWVASNTHGIMTYAKILWNAESRKKYYHFVTWIPPVLIVFSCGIWALWGGSAVVSIYFYALIFHYVRQSYGIGTIYKRASGSLTPNWLNQSVFYVFPLFVLILAMNKGFSIFGQNLYVLNTGKITGVVLFLSVFLIYGIWAFYQAYDFFKGRFSGFYFLSIITHIIIFYIGFMVFDDLMYGWVCLNFWHSSQYILFVWNNLTRVSNQETQGEYNLLKAVTKNIYVFTFLSFVSAAVIMLFIYLMIGQQTLWAVPLFFTITVALNFNHYIMDALVWRRLKANN